MLHQSIKVSLIATSVDQLIYLFKTHQVLSLANSSDNPDDFRDTPVHLETRTILTKTDAVEGLG
jgi:hypothetical protein